jgi:cupin fold WbuC family metalloprotein
MSEPHLTPARLDALTVEARALPRRRLHLNLHAGPDEPCQRLVNAMEPDSYIPPHRHAGHVTHESLLALRGAFALILFDDDGTPREALKFGGADPDLEIVELAPDVWHTVVSLTPGSVLFETKSGPYRPERAKVLADWAPGEGDPAAPGYLGGLISWAEARLLVRSGVAT